MNDSLYRCGAVFATVAMSAVGCARLTSTPASEPLFSGPVSASPEASATARTPVSTGQPSAVSRERGVGRERFERALALYRAGVKRLEVPSGRPDEEAAAVEVTLSALADTIDAVPAPGSVRVDLVAQRMRVPTTPLMAIYTNTGARIVVQRLDIASEALVDVAQGPYKDAPRAEMRAHAFRDAVKSMRASIELRTRREVLMDALKRADAALDAIDEALH